MSIPTAAILPLIARVARDPGGDVTLAAIAAASRSSPFEVHRAFRRVTGEPPKRYTQRLRLERAAAQLVLERLPILEIALANGFASHEVFTRAFLRRFRMSPRSYRARGLVGGARAGARHAAIVRDVGPCIGFYRFTHAPRSITMATTVTRRTVEASHALVIRRTVAPSEIAATLAESLPRVFAHAQHAGVAFAGPPFTRYVHTGIGLLTIEAGMPTATVGRTGDGIDAIELPGGPVAVAIHRGAYDKLGETHAAVARWITAQGLTSAGAPWEVYVTDPGEKPNPADWETEVFYPLAR